jgi:hypothetical protein
MYNLPLTQENKEHEMTIIKQMADVSRFPNMIENLNHKIFHKTPTL